MGGKTNENALVLAMQGKRADARWGRIQARVLAVQYWNSRRHEGDDVWACTAWVRARHWRPRNESEFHLSPQTVYLRTTLFQLRKAAANPESEALRIVYEACSINLSPDKSDYRTRPFCASM